MCGFSTASPIRLLAGKLIVPPRDQFKELPIPLAKRMEERSNAFQTAEFQSLE